MSYDNIARAAEWHYDKLEAQREREEAAREAREEAEAEQEAAAFNRTLQLIRQHLKTPEQVLQLLYTSASAWADERGENDFITMILDASAEKLERSGVKV